MIRISVECPEISPEIMDVITDISKTARRVVRDVSLVLPRNLS